MFKFVIINCLWSSVHDIETSHIVHKCYETSVYGVDINLDHIQIKFSIKVIQSCSMSEENGYIGLFLLVTAIMKLKVTQAQIVFDFILVNLSSTERHSCFMFARWAQVDLFFILSWINGHLPQLQIEFSPNLKSVLFEYVIMSSC